MNVSVRVEIGPSGKTLVLRNSEIERLEVTQELSAHTRCDLFFMRDNDTDTSLDLLLGQPVAVTLTDETGPVTVFTGFVLGGSQSHQQNHGSAFVLEGISNSWSLERPRTAYYPESRLQQIASAMNVKIAGQAPSQEPLQYVQFGETDFAFLNRVADDHGMIVRTTDERPELRLGFETVELPLVWGRNLFAVSAETRTAGHSASGAAHRMQEKQDHRFRNVRSEPAWLGGAQRLAMTATKLSDRAANAGQGVVQELPFRSPLLASARRALEHESARVLGSSVYVDGSAADIRIRAGDTIRLEESQAFRLPTVGVLGVTRVVHRFDGQLYSNEFRATPWAEYVAPAAPERNLAAGIVTGTVVDNVDPTSMGRVKVRMRWNDAGEATRWTRVASMYAGNMRGIYYLPEIGDEVVVAFEMGDPERPIVVGSLWNGLDKAPALGKNEAKRIITRTGNTIQMLDEQGTERIEIFTPEGKCWIQLTNNKGKPVITVHSEGDIAFEAKHEIRFDCETLIQRVSSNYTRKIGGNESADVSGSATIKAGGKIAIDGMNIVIKAGATIDAAAGGIHSIVGAMVHIQPPGKVVPPNQAASAGSPSSPWTKQEVPPPLSSGRTSADPKIPR